MNANGHDDIRSLLGAYALHAVSPLEARRVDRHLAECEHCAREVDLLGGAAAELAHLPGEVDVPQGFADEVVSLIPDRQPRRSPVLGLVAAVAAAALVAVGALGAIVTRERERNDQLVEVVAAAERHVRLEATDGFEGRGVVYVTDERAALVLEDVPEPGPSRSYQLWAIAGERPESMTVIDSGGRVVQILPWDGRDAAFAITVEPAGGSPQPTTDPVLIGS